MSSSEKGKGMMVIPDAETLFKRIEALLDKDRNLVDASVNDIVTLLRDGQRLVFANNQTIPAPILKKACTEAKKNILIKIESEKVVPVVEQRKPTELALKYGGPDFNPELMSPVECKIRVHGDSKVATHHPAYFFIDAYDGTGTRMTEGGENYFVHIRGPARVRGRVRDNGDGTYEVIWTPPLSGWYQISVSCFGVSLPNTPFAMEATPPLPYHLHCVASGPGLTAAIARATQTFEVEFKDKLGNVTAAVDLDVFVDTMPLGSPRVVSPRECFPGTAKALPPTPAEIATVGKSASERAPAKTAPTSAKTPPPPAAIAVSKHDGTSPASLRPPSPENGVHDKTNALSPKMQTLLSPSTPSSPWPTHGASHGYGSHDEADEGDYVRQRTIRYMVKQPLVIRASESLQSPQIGTLIPGQMMTLVLEKKVGKTVRAMIALESISRKTEVVSTDAEKLQDAASPTGGVRDVGDGSDNANAAMHEDIAAIVSDWGIEGLKGKVGWVTTIKDGHRLVTSKVRQSASSRQQHAEQWARRVASDRTFSKIKTDKGEGKKDYAAAAAPNVSLEIKADPSGIGFAYGGLYPGTLYAKGKHIEKHKVSYSIGKVGTYLLHVRLRQQAISIPGSPFLLHVEPNIATALSTKLPVGVIQGKVGKDASSGCGVIIKTFDLMGNACIKGGANVTGNPVDKTVLEDKNFVVTVTDQGDGSYRLHWSTHKSGTYVVAIKIANEHIVGSPTTVKFSSIAPLKEKTVVKGSGLTSGTAGQPSLFRVKFFDMYDNQAIPGPGDKIGLALVQSKSYKDVDQSLKYMMAPVDPEKPWEQEVSFTPSEQGSFSLHIWTEFTTAQGAQERSPVQGSPYTCTVAAGLASSEVSFVDGWTKETRQVDKNGKALEINDKIIAGDAVICQPIICDALGNKTVPSAGQLQVSLALPNGTAVGIDHSSLKLIETTKGGMTSFTVRHDVTNAGDHKMHIQLNSRPIRGSPVCFSVVSAAPDVKMAKLTPPPENTLYANRPYTIVLKTFDRFNNPIPYGGLPVAARMQVVKNNAHDLTTLVSNNHSVEVSDNNDGTYNVSIQLIKIAATVKVIVNMDKNLPVNGGELPPVQLSILLPEGQQPEGKVEGKGK